MIEIGHYYATNAELLTIEHDCNKNCMGTIFIAMYYANLLFSRFKIIFVTAKT